MLSFLVAIGTGIIYYGVKFNFCNCFLILFAILFSMLYLLDFILIIILLFPKSVILKGTHPKDISWIEFSKKYTDEEKVLVTYYHEIIRLGHSIDQMKSFNSERQTKYKCAVVLTALLFIFGAFLIFIFRP